MVKTLSDCDAYQINEKDRLGWTYIEPTQKHEYTVMMLHGLGGTSKFHKVDFTPGYPGYDAKQRVVLPQAGKMLVSAEKSLGYQPSWLNFVAWSKALTKPKMWHQVNAQKDLGGRAIYLSSMIQQSTVNKLVNWYAKTVNEEVCRLAKTSGKVDFSKIFFGGESQGCLASIATLMRGNEFFPEPLGGVYGFIGVVPTLFRNPSAYKTGPFSSVPQATPAQKKFLQGTYARFMWGDADKLFP
jgi:predicted esterase